MLNMLEEDGLGISDEDFKDMNKHDLMRLVKQWKARTLHQHEEGKKKGIKHSNQLAG